MIPVTRTELPLRLLRRGKVRDVYEIDHHSVLLVATDRVSAFDIVMHEAVPHKGAVLTQLTAWWLRQLEGTVLHHMLSASTGEIVDRVPSLEPFARDLAGRSMLCRTAAVYPVECVIRGHISGSAWKEYAAHGTLAGEQLSPGLLECGKLANPLFSPATKAEQGHDENITVSAMEERVGRRQAVELERLTRAVYDHGSRVASERGIIIADTKLEFGYLEDAHHADGSAPRSIAASEDEFDPSRVILVDEVLTPDSSRFWPAESFTPGRSQPSFDKQPLRDYLETERRAGRWNGESPPPRLPGEVVEAMSERYLDIYRRLTLAPLDTGVAH